MDKAEYFGPDADAVIAAIHAGVFEAPLWERFLTLIRRVTGSAYASMSFRRADARDRDVTLIKSGADDAAVVFDDHAAEIVRRLRLPYQSIALSRPYSLQEIVDLDDKKNSEYIDYLTGRNFHDTCVMRVEEADGGQLWLTLGRSAGLYSDSSKDLLRRIAPQLGIAAHSLALIERERMRTSIARDAVQKLNFGWLTLDKRGRVIEIDPGAEALFRDIQGLTRCRPGQIFPFPRADTRNVTELLAIAAEGRSFRSRAIHLLDEPWLDMLIVPIRYRAVSGGVTPIAVGYVHGVGVASSERCEQLVQLFGLTKGEARLALALSQGRNIAEAAIQLGFTVETARNYSKRIYAKTGTRGHADLVRIILASVIALS